MICLTCFLYPHILRSGALACILASSHPYIHMFVCTCLYPRIFTSSYPQIHVPSLASLHPHISDSRVFACNLLSSYSLILRIMYSVRFLVSSHPHVLISLCSCTPGAFWYPCILTFSYPQVRVCLHVTLYPHILLSLGSCTLCACWYSHILISLCSCTPGAGWYPRILISLGLCTPSACWYPRILTSSYILRFMHSGCLLVSSHPHILRFLCSYLCRKLESDKAMLLTKKNGLCGNKQWL